MAIDRLSDLSSSAGLPSPIRGNTASRNTSGVASSMNAFLQQHNAAEQEIQSLNQQIRSLEQGQAGLLQVVQENDRLAMQRKVDAMAQQANAIAQSIRQRLDAMESLRQRASPTDQSAMQNMRTNLASVFRNSVLDLYNAELRQERNEKEQLARQIRIVNPAASEEQVQEMVQSSRTGTVFSQMILQSTRREEAQRVLEEVEDRKQHIAKLAKSVVEIQKLFQDLQLMVDQQQSLFDAIEQNAEQTQINVESATKQLGTAKESARKARAKKRCLLVFFLLLILGVAIWLMFQYWIVPTYLTPAPAATTAPSSGTSAGSSSRKGKRAYDYLLEY